jgi:hypothetical protein
MRRFLVLAVAGVMTLAFAGPALASHGGEHAGNGIGEGLSACSDQEVHPAEVASGTTGPVISHGVLGVWWQDDGTGCRVLEPLPVGNGPLGDGPPGHWCYPEC